MSCRNEKRFLVLLVLPFLAVFCILLILGSVVRQVIAYAEEIASTATVTQSIYWGIDEKTIVEDNNTTVFKTLIISCDDLTVDAELNITDSGVVGSDGNNEQEKIGWENHSGSVNAVEIRVGVVPSSTYGWFYNLINCTEIDLTGLNTSQVTNMSYMFGIAFN